MMEAENSMHSDHMRDDEIRQHDVETNVTKLFIISGQVSVETAVNIPQVVNGLKHNLLNIRVNYAIIKNPIQQENKKKNPSSC